MGYSHPSAVSSRNGYAVGAINSERKIVASDGTVKVPFRSAAGDVQYTKINTAAIKGTATATASATLTTTVGTTATTPVHFFKVKFKATGNASKAHVFKVKIGGTTATTTTKTTTTTTITKTLTTTDPSTSPAISVQDVATSLTSNVLSLVSAHVEKKRTVMLGTVT